MRYTKFDSGVEYTAHAKCSSCDAIESVVVDIMDANHYLNDDKVLIQNVFPDLSVNDREILIGWRAQKISQQAFHLCGECWDVQLGGRHEDSYNQG
jgi:hypothetical protein